MDTVPLPPRDVENALGFLELTNRWFGGTAVVLRWLRSWSSRWPRGQPISLLDVGTGAADIPLAVARWARRQGWRVQVTAIDSVASVAAIARARTAGTPGVKVEVADVFDLARRNVRFDYVTASLFLHHFPPGRTAEALLALDHLARCGLIVSDLRRTWPSYAAVGLMSFLAGNAVVRHDGPLSVRRAFRVAELQQLAREAGSSYLVARRERWFRLSLAGEKPCAARSS